MALRPAVASADKTTESEPEGSQSSVKRPERSRNSPTPLPASGRLMKSPMPPRRLNDALNEAAAFRPRGAFP